MRDKTKTWSGMFFATEWLWLISALTWEPQLDKEKRVTVKVKKGGR